MNKFFLFLLLSVNLFFCSVKAQMNGKIKIYFTHPVNTAVSSGISAQHLNNSMDDTLVEYIKRAKYSIDIAVYNYQQSTGMANIATAINTAAAGGVIVRWIYDAAQSNSGMSTLIPSVHTLGSPTTSSYGIMHNKFMIIDANSANPSDPLVWTGSTNWTKTHFTANVNNSVIIQDKNLALAYLSEFNEMWGASGITPGNSKFGPFKTDNTNHSFTIGGSLVELYFSPTDSTSSHVVSAINSANTDLHFGMLALSSTITSNAVITKKNNGVNVSGIADQSSQFYTAYNQLSAALGNQFKTYNQLTSVYHNKILLADPCNNLSDPTVVTGSFNWTNPAETINDENTLIIHDASVANIFYQSYSQNFIDLNGTLSPCLSSGSVENLEETFSVYTQYNNGELKIKWNTEMAGDVNITVTDVLGKSICTSHIDTVNDGTMYTIVNCNLNEGIYFVRIQNNNKQIIKKIMIAG